MTKRLLSWLLVLALLVGVCVTALADEPTIPDGGGCAHSYAIVKGPRKTSYSDYSASYHYKYVRQERRCAYCASTAWVDVENPTLEAHNYSTAMSGEKTSYTYHNASYHYKKVTKLMKCAYCASTTDVVIEPAKLETHSWVIRSKELVGDRYMVTKLCQYCGKTLYVYED